MLDAFSLLHKTTSTAARHSFTAVIACLVVAALATASGWIVLCHWFWRILADEPASGRAVGGQRHWNVSRRWLVLNGRRLAQRADAIVVLGSGRERGDLAWGEDQPTGVGLERQRYAARLAKASGLPILTSGGLHYGTPPTEAKLMADSLLDDFGVTVRWQEGESRTTWENAKFSADMLLPQGIKRVVVVTQAWHMPRAVWSFQQAGFDVVPAPVGFLGTDNARPLGGWMPEFKSIWQSGQLLNEAVGQVGYSLFYR
jgi:uncharacterized SAM-binding protein YcdF (DUF218 family)